jgi:hypothetical protein
MSWQRRHLEVDVESEEHGRLTVESILRQQLVIVGDALRIAFRWGRDAPPECQSK